MTEVFYQPRPERVHIARVDAANPNLEIGTRKAFVEQEPAGIRTVSMLDFQSSLVGAVGGGVEVGTTPAGNRTHPVFHIPDSTASIAIDVQLDDAASESITVPYILGGTAVEGTHYTISAGASPLVFAVGESAKQIVISPVAPTAYYPEKLVTVTLDAANTTAQVHDELNLNHVWIRSTVDPPDIEFTDATTSISHPHTAAINVQKAAGTTDHLEDIRVWVTATGTATEGVDWEWVPSTAAPNGLYTIPQTAPNRDLLIRPLSGGSGTVNLTLRHELNDQSEINQWSQSANLHLEAPRNPDHPLLSFITDTTPGFPGDCVTGPGESNPPLPLTVLNDPSVLTPWGETTQVLQYSEDAGTIPSTTCVEWEGQTVCGADANGPAYIRKSAEGQLHGAGPDNLAVRTPEYVRFSVYYALPSSPIEASRFVRIGTRDRGFLFDPPQTNNHNETNHGIVFDRESPVATHSHSTGEWAIWSTQNGDPDDDTVAGGIRIETLRKYDGTTEDYLRLWIETYCGDSARVNLNFWNTIHYAVWFSPQDGGTSHGYTPVTATASSQSIVGGQPAHRGKGGIFFWPMLEYGSSPLTGAPGQYHPRAQNFWEPNGGATTDSAGQNTHTVTIS